jgi:hypothetical protein
MNGRRSLMSAQRATWMILAGLIFSACGSSDTQPQFPSQAAGGWNMVILGVGAQQCGGALSITSTPASSIYALQGFWNCGPIGAVPGANPPIPGIGLPFNSGTLTGSEDASSTIKLTLSSKDFADILITSTLAGGTIHGQADGSGFAAAMFSAKRM